MYRVSQAYYRIDGIREQPSHLSRRHHDFKIKVSFCSTGIGLNDPIGVPESRMFFLKQA